MRRTSLFFLAGLVACSEAASVSDPGPADASRDAAAMPSEAGSELDSGLAPPDDAASDAAISLAADGENPVSGDNLPDPDILRVVAADGGVSYILSGTVDSGDFRAYRSTDLVHWAPRPGLFGSNAGAGPSLELGGASYCALWAPAMTTLASGRSFLTFTATRFESPRAECPEAAEDTGVYVAENTDPQMPFTNPVPLDTVDSCQAEQPYSVEWAGSSCLGVDCERVARLDGEPFVDPADGRAWLGYAWYTSTPPTSAWEENHYGEHVSVVELDPTDLRRVACAAAEPIHVGDPHDAATLAALAASCPRCDEHLSFTHGRDGEDVERDGHPWGVVEAPSFLRRGMYVYVFLSASVWDSADYSVYYAFAPTVAELALDSPTRRVGRLLIPGQDQSFGHGSPVLGPDGEHWFFVHHRLRHASCLADDDCRRDVWISPLDFDDHDDGLGAVWPRPVFPGEEPAVHVPLATP